MLKPSELGNEALAYIQSQLSQGHSLSAELLRLPLERGRIITYLPAKVDARAIRRFDAGGVTARAETEPEFAKFISDYLDESEERAVIFEDALARTGDPFLSSLNFPVITCQNEVYYLLTSVECHSLNTITRVLRRAASYFLLAVFSLRDGLRPGMEVTPTVLGMIAHNAKHFAVGAYDGEGELTWTRG